MSFAIASVPLGTGRLGISPAPGRWGDYAADLEVLRVWGPDLVLSMTGPGELASLGAAGFARDLQRLGIGFCPLPVVDFGAPDAAVRAAWPAVSARAHRVLGRGGRVLAHCRGGCGRSGMAALRLMVETGEPPRIALDRLRAARPCAVETEAQLAWASNPPPAAAGANPPRDID